MLGGLFGGRPASAPADAGFGIDGSTTISLSDDNSGEIITQDVDRHDTDISGVVVDDKIRAQMKERGWTIEEILDLIETPVAGTTRDQRRPGGNWQPDSIIQWNKGF